MRKDMTRSFGAAVALAMVCLLTLVLSAACQTQEQTSFASPEEAVEAIVQAAAGDLPALLAMFGPEGKDLIVSGDAVQDEKERADLVRRAREKTTIVRDPSNPGRATLRWARRGPRRAIHTAPGLHLYHARLSDHAHPVEGKYSVLDGRAGLCIHGHRRRVGDTLA